MRYEILDRPDFAMGLVTFEAEGEQLVVEASAMVAKSAEVAMKTSAKGGMLASAGRRLLGGESFFQNTFTASAAGETLYFAPGPQGDIVAHDLVEGETLLMSSGAFLAAAPTVTLDTQWEGARGLFSGTGVFLLRARGEGPLFFHAYGGLHQVVLDEARRSGGYLCDTQHLVAFTSGLRYKVERVGGLKSTLFSGEGLVCRFSGEGSLWISTRNPSALAAFLHPFRSVRRG